MILPPIQNPSSFSGIISLDRPSLILLKAQGERCIFRSATRGGHTAVMVAKGWEKFVSPNCLAPVLLGELDVSPDPKLFKIIY